MRLEERVTTALRAQTDLLVPVSHELPMIRAAARARSRRRVGVVAGIVAGICASGVLLVVQPGDVGGDGANDVAPAAPGARTSSPPSTTGPLDTSAWRTHRSDQYDIRLAYPGDWKVTPAVRAWTSDADSADPLSPAHDSFESPAGDVRVSMWFVPLDPATDVNSTFDLVAWAEDYCEATGNAPCTGIEDRAVELCLEARDCHPGLLVPFESEVQAFFTGGIYDADAMTIVSVWRPERHPSVRPYGGARRLLEAFLSTMEVWPASTPFSSRVGGRYRP